MPKNLKCPHCGKTIPEAIVSEHIRERARKTGSVGGKKLATERGPEYFKNLQAKRKTKSGGTAGGRPPASD